MYFTFYNDMHLIVLANSSMLSIDEEDEQEIKEYSRANVKSTRITYLPIL